MINLEQFWMDVFMKYKGSEYAAEQANLALNEYLKRFGGEVEVDKPEKEIDIPDGTTHYFLSSIGVYGFYRYECGLVSDWDFSYIIEDRTPMQWVSLSHHEAIKFGERLGRGDIKPISVLVNE